MIFVYPDEIAPSLYGIDPMNAKSYQFPALWDGVAVSKTISAGQRTPWIITPRGVTKVYLQVLSTTSGHFYVEYTCDSLAAIKAGTATYFRTTKYTVPTLVNCDVVSAIRVLCDVNTIEVNYHAR